MPAPAVAPAAAPAAAAVAGVKRCVPSHGGWQCIHAGEFVHNDIKTGNLMVMQDKTLKIIDLGVAFPFDHPGLLERTKRDVGGTRIFAPPEVVACYWFSEYSWRESVDAFELAPDRILQRIPPSMWVPQYRAPPPGPGCKPNPHRTGFAQSDHIPTYQVDMWAAGCVLDLLLTAGCVALLPRTMCAEEPCLLLLSSLCAFCASSAVRLKEGRGEGCFASHGGRWWPPSHAAVGATRPTAGRSRTAHFWQLPRLLVRASLAR